MTEATVVAGLVAVERVVKRGSGVTVVLAWTGESVDADIEVSSHSSVLVETGIEAVTGPTSTLLGVVREATTGLTSTLLAAGMSDVIPSVVREAATGLTSTLLTTGVGVVREAATGLTSTLVDGAPYTGK